MTEHVQKRFRRGDIYQEYHYRQWIFDNLPHYGFGVQDLDLVLHIFGKSRNTDKQGCIMLVELKFGHKSLTYSQQQIFGLMHRLMRKADPESVRYKGYFVVNYSYEHDWNKSTFHVNGVRLGTATFKRFLLMTPAVLDKIKRDGQDPFNGEVILK